MKEYILATHRRVCVDKREGEFFITIDVLKNALLGLPLPPAVRDDPQGKDMMRLDKLASQLMAATHALQKSKSERDQNYYSARALQLDSQIDEIVEQMYGLEVWEADTLAA